MMEYLKKLNVMGAIYNSLVSCLLLVDISSCYEESRWPLVVRKNNTGEG